MPTAFVSGPAGSRPAVGAAAHQASAIQRSQPRPAMAAETKNASPVVADATTPRCASSIPRPASASTNRRTMVRQSPVQTLP